MIRQYLPFFVLILSLAFAACSKKDSKPEMLPTGNFGRANTLAFYWFDDKGVNLVQKHGYKAFTVEYPDNPSTVTDFSSDINPLTDNQGRQCLTLSFRGWKGTLTSTFNISMPGLTPDKVELKYRLITEGVVGGPYAAEIEWLKINGTKVYSETDGKTWSGTIIITRGANKTTIATKF